jgi:hypothetical protein
LVDFDEGKRFPLLRCRDAPPDEGQNLRTTLIDGPGGPPHMKMPNKKDFLVRLPSLKDERMRG